jgi:cytochrome c oxidase subunit 1
MQPNVQQFPPFREQPAAHGHDDHSHGAHAHHEPNFWQKYIFSTDHKVIGIQYGFMALCFMLFGFGLMLLMRWQIAHPGMAVPLFGPLLHAICGDMAPGVKDAE